uniref:KH domain-containing protein n=2 Tax=Caenorhabditis tropicalis TaxID=1561998 RepID=A0A1I7TFZ4_9PELO
MNASFPLSLGTYSVNNRKYRKTSYEKTTVMTYLNCRHEQTFGDTPDFYADEPAVQCLYPCNLTALKKKIENNDPKKLSTENSSEKEKRTEDERIKVIGDKKWTSQISVPSCFLGSFIGKNRRALTSLENETQTRIQTPRRSENKPCEISSFASCKNPQLFTKPSRLHLTLSVVRIFDDSDFQKVSAALEALQKEIKTAFLSQPLTAVIQGIDMMNDDPSQVSVLYAKVSGDKVQQVADYVNKRLLELGVGIHNQNLQPLPVKLHMTLMNARYARQSEKDKKPKELLTFDAKTLLQDLGTSYFGTLTLSEINLCPLSSNSSAEGKYYEKQLTIRLA